MLDNIALPEAVGKALGCTTLGESISLPADEAGYIRDITLNPNSDLPFLRVAHAEEARVRLSAWLNIISKPWTKLGPGYHELAYNPLEEALWVRFLIDPKGNWRVYNYNPIRKKMVQARVGRAAHRYTDWAEFQREYGRTPDGLQALHDAIDSVLTHRLELSAVAWQGLAKFVVEYMSCDSLEGAEAFREKHFEEASARREAYTKGMAPGAPEPTSAIEVLEGAGYQEFTAGDKVRWVDADGNDKGLTTIRDSRSIIIADNIKQGYKPVLVGR